MGQTPPISHLIIFIPSFLLIILQIQFELMNQDLLTSRYVYIRRWIDTTILDVNDYMSSDPY